MTERKTAAELRGLLAQTSGRQPESLVLQQVRDYLRALGWYVIRVQQGLGAHRGLSDLICVKDGRTVFVECKTAKGKLSEHQQAFQDAIKEGGGEYRVARSIDDVMDMGRRDL